MTQNKTHINREIQEHEDKYIHLPKVKLLWVLATIGLAIITYLHTIYVLDWEVIKLAFVSSQEIQNSGYLFTIKDLSIVYSVLVSYILFSITSISFVKIFKERLKNYKEYGLIYGLIVGLIVGLIAGLIAGLIYGLIVGLITGLILGLIAGLIAGLIYGLIYGLIVEFQED